LPSGGYVITAPEMFELKDVLDNLGINKDQLLVLGILVGTDYNPGGVKGIGPKKALILVKEKRYPVKIFEDLEKEGRAREIVRRVQLMRKEMGLGLTDKIKLTLTGYPPEFEDYIKKETLSLSLESADKDLVSLA